MKYAHATILGASLLVSASASAEDFGPTAAQQPNVTYRVMTSPSALDAGQNSNYPLDPQHSVPLMSSPSANDVGQNSNYPLDPQHMVAMDNSSVVMPNNNGPVQSANSLPVSIAPQTRFANHRTQPVVRGNAATAQRANPNG